MPTNRPTETRHRWTAEERQRLVEKSKPFTSIGDAADALYVEFQLPRRAVYAQLYDLYLRGQAPHLSVDHATRSPAFARALREMIRVMRVEHATDLLISLHDDQAEVQVSPSTFTVDL